MSCMSFLVSMYRCTVGLIACLFSTLCVVVVVFLLEVFVLSLLLTVSLDFEHHTEAALAQLGVNGEIRESRGAHEGSVVWSDGNCVCRWRLNAAR